MSTFTNLNDSNPPAPPGNRNAKWQVGSLYVDDEGRIVRDASCYEPDAGGGGPGGVHDEPLTDGNMNFIFVSSTLGLGDCIVVIGVPN